MAPVDGIPEEELRFGEAVIAQGLATREQVEKALDVLRRLAAAGISPLPRLGPTLVRQGFLGAGTEEATRRPSAPAAPAGAAPRPPEVEAALSDPARLFGKFVLLERVGQGGFGEVWKAWQSDLSRIVALKRLLNTGEEQTQRFEREGRLAGSLTHPNIVPVYEAGIHDGRHYLAMEFVDGGSLEKAALDPLRVLEIGRCVAAALAFAHEHGVIHRDLKPQNLLLGADGRVRVTDFGLARETQSGTTLTLSGEIFGTPAFMSPEQAQGGKCDARSDVYSLGATLYTLFTGSLPFPGNSPAEVLHRVRHDDPTPPRRLNARIPREAEIILQKALEKDPRRRYASMRDLGEDLRRAVSNESILARPEGRFRRLLKWGRRHPVASAVAAVSAAAAVLLSSLAVIYVRDLSAARDAESREARRTEFRLAEARVAEGDALLLASDLDLARDRYREAAGLLAKLGRSSVPATLGLWESFRRSPPPVAILNESGPATVAFVEGGKRVITGGPDGQLRLWEPETGRPLLATPGHEGPVACLAATPRGDRFVTGGDDGEVLLWEYPGPRRIRPLRRSGAPIRGVCLSLDGSRAASIDANRRVEVCESGSGRVLCSPDVENAGSIALALSPDGRSILVGTRIFEIKLLDAETGRFRGELRGHTDWPLAVAFSPDGKSAVSGGEDLVVRLWNLETFNERAALHGHRKPVHAVAFSPDGKTAASAGVDRIVRTWDAVAGRESGVHADQAVGVVALAYSPDSLLLAASSGDGGVRLWDCRPGLERRLFEDNKAAGSAGAVSPDGRLALTSGLRMLILWDLATLKPLRTLPSPVDRVRALACSPDFSRVLVGGESATPHWIRLSDGKVLKTLPGHSGPVTSLALSPSGNAAVTGSEDGTVRWWTLDGDGPGRILGRHKGSVHAVDVSPDGARVLSAGDGGHTLLWDVDGGPSPPAPEPTGKGVLAARYAPDGRLIATAGLDNAVTVRDARTGSTQFLLRGHDDIVRALAFSPDGKILYSAGRDQTLRLWDLETGGALRVIRGYAAEILGLALTPDGRKVITLGAERTPCLWDLGRVDDYRRWDFRMKALGTDASALSTTAGRHAFLGRWDVAASLWERARSAGADIPGIDLARSHWQAGRLDAARREFARLQAADPDPYLKLCLDAVEKPENTGLRGREAAGQMTADIAKALILIKEFPPSVWTPEKIEEVRGRSRRGETLSAGELKFLENHHLWEKTRLFFRKKTPDVPAPREP